MLSEFQNETLSILKRLHRSLAATDPSIPIEIKQTITVGLADLLLIIPSESEYLIPFSSCFSLVSAADFQFEPTECTTAKKYLYVLLLASREALNKSATDYLYKSLQVTGYLPG